MAFQIRTVGRTNTGMVRTHNEDNFLIIDLSTNSPASPEPRSHTVEPAGMLALVADGMGGAAAGEVASQMVAESMATWFAQRSPSGELTDDVAELLLKEAVQTSNETVFQHASDNPHLRGMGSTLTCGWIRSGSAHIVQVGDSRAYLLRDGSIRQLTQDQSLQEHLVMTQGVSPEEAKARVDSNVIIQAMGVRPTVRPVTSSVPLQKGDLLLLCSDGLNATMSDERILDTIADGDGLDEVASELITVANALGGPDNITVVMMRVDSGGRDR